MFFKREQKEVQQCSINLIFLQSNREPIVILSGIFSDFFIRMVLVMVLSIVVACGGGSTSNSSGSNGKITMTEMDYWSVPAQGATLNKLFNQYQKFHPNITIQRNAVPFDNLLPKADQEAASHTLPNILVLDNPDVAQFASTGALTPLDSFMQGKFSDSDFYAGPLTTMKYQDKIYSFPVGNNDLALFYNKKALLLPNSATHDLERTCVGCEGTDTWQHLWFCLLRSCQ